MFWVHVSLDGATATHCSGASSVYPEGKQITQWQMVGGGLQAPFCEIGRKAFPLRVKNCKPVKFHRIQSFFPFGRWGGEEKVSTKQNASPPAQLQILKRSKRTMICPEKVTTGFAKCLNCFRAKRDKDKI